MSDATVEYANRLEHDVIRKVARMYPAALSPVLEKHEETLQRLDKLMQEGAKGRARVLMRRSGLLKDVARALAGAGVKVARLVSDEIDSIREAVGYEPETIGEAGEDRGT